MRKKIKMRKEQREPERVLQRLPFTMAIIIPQSGLRTGDPCLDPCRYSLELSLEALGCTGRPTVLAYTGGTIPSFWNPKPNIKHPRMAVFLFSFLLVVPWHALSKCSVSPNYKNFSYSSRHLSTPGMHWQDGYILLTKWEPKIWDTLKINRHTQKSQSNKGWMWAQINHLQPSCILSLL